MNEGTRRRVGGWDKNVLEKFFLYTHSSCGCLLLLFAVVVFVISVLYDWALFDALNYFNVMLEIGHEIK